MRLKGELGPLERAVMDVIWDGERDVTVRDVLETRAGRGLAYTTVMTILDRLWKKGYVTRRRRGRAFAYRARVDRESYLEGLMDEVFANASDRREVLLGFVKGASDDDLAELRRILRSVERQRGGPPRS
jgi:predicted transcriptional regulator